MSCSGHSHDHEHAEEVTTNLREYIDFNSVTCLNESIAGSIKSVLKDTQSRMSRYPSMMSSDVDDPELLIHVPFVESVTIDTFCIRGPSPPSSNADSTTEIRTACPKHVKIFTNRDDIDFTMANELNPVMELDLVHPNHETEVIEQGEGGGTIDYKPERNRGKFQNISSITIYVQNNWGIEEENDECATEISYIGFKGKGMNVRRKAVDTVYESIAMKGDHTVKGEHMAQFGL